MRTLVRRIAVLALLVVLAGCQAILPLFYPTDASLAAKASRPATATINLLVHWPTGPGRDFRGYHAQLIPDSSALVVATVYDGPKAIGTASVVRTVGQATVTIPVTVPVGDGYTLLVKAYPANAAPSATAGVIAQGSAAGVNTLGLTLATQHTLTVNVTLTSLYVPAITGMSSQAGAEGHTVQLTGTNLAPEWEIALPVVKFNGTAAATVTRQGAGTITATVPAGATVGNIVVVADGVPSVSTANYWVVSSIGVTTTSPPIGGNTVEDGLIYYLADQDYFATLGFNFKSGETLATYPGRPAVVWTIQNAAHSISSQGETAGSATVTATGRVTAAGSYSSGLATARLGTSLASFLARSVGVNSVTLSTSAFTINALPPSGQTVSSTYLSQTYRDVTATVNHSLPFNDGVAWSTSHAELVAADQTTSGARITTSQGAVAATRTFTATSITDGSKTGVGTVTVTDYGQLLLGVQ